MNKNVNFPSDPDTVRIIKEMEVYLEFQHENIMMMETWELHEYINKLTLLIINGSKLGVKWRKIYKYNC
ncbi:hypothetical protein [Clostridium beijerinckii]|uniref:Uncharacterized protein n=1 Tax=Clostridium beijerinckii TaxID=1520 RepID=A0A1S9N2P7_CLOBE|nr:hypothetical protein [Clostridium beijerinckii]OOP71712.1 hypothetical protein CBEIBR21_19080 [Clostridium beijerinckii]